MLKKILFALLFLPVFAFADSSKGEKLLNHLWKDMKENDVKAIKKYTSDDFQSVHYDGARNRCQELELIANLHLQSYTLSDVKITKEKNVFIISYFAETEELINGLPVTKKAPRLTIFEKVKDKWKWVAHSSLVVPRPV